MTVRTFNYTGRMLIPQECITSNLEIANGGPPSLMVDFDFEKHPPLLDLPPSSEVFVDASHGMSFMRFMFGAVENPTPPDDTELADLDSWTSASFVVRIANEGRLLAKSKKMTLTTAAPDNKTRRSLIVPEYRDLEERPWMLEVNETMPIPKLVFNEKWWAASIQSGFPLKDDAVVMNSIMPSILEGMLEWLLIHNEGGEWHSLFDDPSWKGGWIRLACRVVDPLRPPDREGDGEYENVEQVLEWIRKAVSAFSDSKGLASSLSNQYGGF